MTDLIILAILALICGTAAIYIYKEKKRGAKCVGCHASTGCGGCKGTCEGCDGCSHQ